MLFISYIKFVCIDSGGGGRKSVRSKIASSLLPAKKEIPTTNTVSNSGGGKRGKQSLSSERSSETKIQEVELLTISLK
jgi:hypothetical protein